jgi:hypothetical protein
MLTDQDAPEPWGFNWPNYHHERLLRAAFGAEEQAVAAFRLWKRDIDIDQLDGGSQAILPLAHHNLTRIGLDDPLLPFCKGFYRRTWYLNQLNFHHMTGILRALHQVGIRRLLLLKGASMAVAYYRDHGLRAMGDFDFQVPLDQSQAVPAMLVDWGWRPKSPLPRRHGWDFTDADGRKLDLHWYALYACSTPGIDDDFWAAARPAKLEDVPVEVLAPTDQLLHVIAHGVRFQGGTPLRWIADALTILNLAVAENDPIDWPRFVAAAHRRELADMAFDGLSYLAARFEAAIPADVFVGLRPPPPEPQPDEVPALPQPVEVLSLAERVGRCWRLHGSAEVMRRAVRRGASTLQAR